LYLLDHRCYFYKNLQDVWSESSSVNLANLLNISATIPDIQGFSWGITFFGPPCIPKEHLIGYNFVADNTGLSSFISCCWLPNLRNPTKFQENSRL